MRESSAGTQPDSDRDTAPLVGRLQLQDRIIDLTVNAFADTPDGTGGPGVVPTRSYARVMADCQLRERENPRNGNESTPSNTRDRADEPGPWNSLRNSDFRP